MSLTVAVPKGRVLKALAKLMGHAGLSVGTLLDDDRTLIREAPSEGLRFLLVKPDDVPTYVEYGAAELGVCGGDVLYERQADVYQPLDLGIGRCRMVVAGPADWNVGESLPRVATKYPRIANEHFAKRGVQADVIYVQGSVELAPITGLADVIVDLVETGDTLRSNGLVVLEEVMAVSSFMIANRAAYKLQSAHVKPIIEQLRQAVHGAHRA